MTVPTAIRRLTGIHAATVTPMRPDYSVDWEALAGHVGRIGRADGIRGLLINGHAGENFLLTREEKRRVIEICRAELGPDVFLTSGVNAESSLEAALHAADAEAAGADALLLFPPNAWIGFRDTASARLHHEHVIAAGRLPILLYQAPVGAGSMPYGPDTLAELVALPRVAGIKEGSWEVATYDQNRRIAKAIRPDLAVLGSGDEHLLTAYLIGSEGSQVSLAAVTPEPLVALWDAASRQDWAAARHWHDVIYPLACAIYRDRPSGRATPRLKACLRILGLLEHDTVRPPFAPIPAEEYGRLEKALRHAGAFG
ncbi:dihydrodipicolinate synthase family protein [Prosthecodimorpha staleyi]|uniref:Dihydrodipicolinate synthase family protein n=1 Tax=Prosthecodimorpha staleyi TaxID=2840188 RepID=A0A947D790_9HYPH|nr:dihydrodipicolinate synthase family protein [Prosthecodimorpha staleyi]MBT9291653.1 dihydrodipicolinate synthase family protein [Prosthecodimorpha staleyi]